MTGVIRTLASLLLSGWILGNVQAGALRDPDEFFFDQTFGDLREELQNARDQGKRGLLVFFEMEECPFCHRMKTTVLNRRDVQDFYRKHFVIIRLDIEGDVEIEDFKGRTISQKDFAFREHRVRATPVFIFFDLEGEQVARYTGATRDAREFLWLGEYVAGGIYREKSFTRYKREKKKQQGSH